MITPATARTSARRATDTSRGAHLDSPRASRSVRFPVTLASIRAASAGAILRVVRNVAIDAYSVRPASFDCICWTFRSMSDMS